MKFVTSVSKMYKHRGLHNHRKSTKKYWHIIGYEYDDYEEEWKMFCEQVSWIKAMYYKRHKYKRIKLGCPECKTVYYHYMKKYTNKSVGEETCPDCYYSFKELYTDFIEEHGL